VHLMASALPPLRVLRRAASASECALDPLPRRHVTPAPPYLLLSGGSNVHLSGRIRGCTCCPSQHLVVSRSAPCRPDRSDGDVGQSSASLFVEPFSRRRVAPALCVQRIRGDVVDQLRFAVLRARLRRATGHSDEEELGDLGGVA